MRNDSGFTMVEIIIVVAVLSVITAIAGFGYLTLRPSLQLSGAARKVAGDLMSARMKAVTQNNEFKVFFLNDREYRILDDNDNDGVADGTELAETKDIQDDYPGVVVASTSDPIFSSKGTVDSVSTVTLSNPSGTKSVAIAITGRIKIN